jgi:molybdopterin molybdotransferase
VIPLPEVQAAIFGAVEPLAPVDVDLRDALGLVLAERVTAPEAVPPFPNTAMDGYAVQAADTAAASEDHPVRLRVVGELAAGHAPTVAVGAGEAIRIMTGAPMPDGADAIVMVERTTRDGDDGVNVTLAVDPGQHVRRAGGDLEAGDVVFEPGAMLTAARLGVLATIDARRVKAFPRARVGVLSTGDELVEGGAPLAPGQIRESNRSMLLALVAQAGCVPVDLGLVRDDEVAITEAVQGAAATCDAVVTSGGVSMGDYDLIKVVLDHIADMRWMQIAIKPAKPFAFGTIRTGERVVPVFGLPGNPVSSLVSFEVLARPALRQMMGQPAIDHPTVRAVADDGLPRHPDGKLHLVRTYGHFEPDGRWHVRSTGAQGSHQLASTAAADGLALVPDGDGVRPGGDVDVLLIGW